MFIQFREPRIAKRDFSGVSFLPIIALLVILFIGMIRCYFYNNRKKRLGASNPRPISPLPPPDNQGAGTNSQGRSNEVELEDPPPPPYQPDKLPPYPAAPSPVHVRDTRG